MRKIEIRLSKNEVKKISRKSLEDQFMEVQDNSIRQAKEIVKKNKEIERKNKEIERKNKEIEKLKEKNKQDENNQKIKEANNSVNRPSSKKPEWDKDGNPKPKRKRPKNKNGGTRKGSGNKSKENIGPTETNRTSLDNCPECGEDLQDQEPIDLPSRIVVDIPEYQKPIISEEIVERKWCPICQKIVSSKSESALPGSDYGLNVMALSAYFWVATAISLPNIAKYLGQFFGLIISTSGISKMMVRLSEILTPVYDEILCDVRLGACLWADETGWRIKGKLHWMWAFANRYSAYYWIDRSRGSDVVNRLLGDIFAGVLIADGWGAYNHIVSDRQTCMPHIYRKIRKYIEINPGLRSLLKFYLKLRRILRDAEKLKNSRKDLDEITFHRRLKKLKKRLSILLKWKQPNHVLKMVIDKVKRQEDYIFTFVEHEEATSHNNFAETIIKKGVLKRKISGGSMSLVGANAYCVILSIAQTCHMRKLSFYKFLKTSLIHYIRTGRPMLLSQYEANFDQEEVKKAS